jgi:hypothetical protein
MNSGKVSLLLPILLISIGIGWLLSTLGIIPSVDWVWTLGLAAVGLLAFAIGGVDKVTVVIGPLFIVASCLSILRQTDRLHFNVEVPILVIVSGILLLAARSRMIPAPKWILEAPPTGPKP